MPVAQATQTFAGIENEFYSHHYLAEVFLGNIRAQIDRWNEAEAAENGPKAPPSVLRSIANRWNIRRLDLTKSKDLSDRHEKFVQQQKVVLEALGYTIQPRELELHAGLAVPVWQCFGDAGRAPHLVIAPTYNGQPVSEEQADDSLSLSLTAAQYESGEVPSGLRDLTWDSIVSEALFGADQPPRYVILIGVDEWLLLDRFKWPNNRLLRLNWREILDRRETPTLQAAAALLHRDSLVRHREYHFSRRLKKMPISTHLASAKTSKYALREAIELIGNEAASQLRQQAVDAKKGFFSANSLEWLIRR